MATDASIYGNALRQGPSFLEQVAGYQGLENSKTQNMLAKQAYEQNALKAQMAQQGASAKAAQQQAIASAYQRSVLPNGQLDQNKLRSELAAAGQGEMLPELDKTYAGVNKDNATATKTTQDTQTNALKVSADLLGTVTDQASLDRARQQAQAYGFKLDGIPTTYDPNQIKQLQQQTLSALDRMQQANKDREFGLNQQQFGESQRHNKASEGAAYMNANAAMMNAKTTQGKAAQEMAGQYDPTNQVIINKQTGVATPVTMNGQAMGGKEERQKLSDAKEVLAILDQATPIIDKATGSYTGAAMNALRGGVTGSSGEKGNANAQLKALQGALVSKMPKMSGPQSDKDVALYREMAGNIGDPTVPADQKKAAMQVIREIQNRYLGGPGQTQQAPAASSALPQGWSITPVQ